MILPSQLKVLVVDDNAYARVGASAILRKLGVGTVDEAASGAAALGMLFAGSYHALFLDWYMPDMNGAALVEVLHDLRVPPQVRVPIVVMTAYPTREAILRARELGAGEVLTKPIAANHVALALGRILPADWSAPTPGDSVLTLTANEFIPR